MLCEKVKTKVGASAAHECNIGERETGEGGSGCCVRLGARCMASSACFRAQPACLACVLLAVASGRVGTASPRSLLGYGRDMCADRSD